MLSLGTESQEGGRPTDSMAFLPPASFGPHISLWQTHLSRWWYEVLGRPWFQTWLGTHSRGSHANKSLAFPGQVSSFLTALPCSFSPRNCIYPCRGWRRVRGWGTAHRSSGAGARVWGGHSWQELLLPSYKHVQATALLGCVHWSSSSLGQSENLELTKAYV